VLGGRDPDCARIDEVLVRARSGRSGALALRGEAGIGKTALLDCAISGAEGMTVVRAVGVEGDAELQFSGLFELLRPLVAHFDAIPAHQADALRSALGLGAAEAVDRFTVGAATLNVLAAAAEERPVVVIADDVQWLDAATIDALLFVARRLVADAVAILLAIREDDSDGSVELRGIDSIHIRGLAADNAAQLLGDGVAPDIARRIAKATGGNPLALLEARRQLSREQLAGREPLPEPLPAGDALERAFAARAASLPEESRLALVLVSAALAHEDGIDTLAAAFESLGVDAAALEPAEDAGLVAVAEGRIVFHHPLVRSAVYHRAPPSARRAAHRALAASLDDPERRAWHLAGAVLGPDEEAAAALELAARLGAERSHYGAAAAALERAAGLSRQLDARLRRLHGAADAAFRAGRTDHAATLIEEPAAANTDPHARAAALRLAARIEYLQGRAALASEHLVEAAELLHAVDPALAVELYAEACTTRQIVGEPLQILAAAERAEWAAAAVPDERIRRLARFTRGWALCGAGRVSEGLPLVEQFASAADVPAEPLDPLEVMRGSLALDWLDRSCAAHRYAITAVDRARAEGAVGVLPYLLLQQAWHAVRAGFLHDGYAAASEALGLARELDPLLPRMQALLILAAATARRGDDAECRAYAEEVGPLADARGLRVFRIWRLYSLGILALAPRRLDDAARQLERAAGELEDGGLHSPSFVPRAELVEVYARVGRDADAEQALDRFEASPEAASPLGRAAAARAQGLVASNAEFETCFENALAAHERSDDRWSLARTRLCFGERLRREGRRTDAREHLRPALETFEELEARPWAERARGELRATGETRRRRADWEHERLTPQELQIVLHVARGLTNREVGTALFLSHKTIEFHLGRVYRKLGLRSRGQLIQRFGAAAREAESALM